MGIERDTKRSYGTASSESGATRLDATRIVSSVSAVMKSAPTPLILSFSSVTPFATQNWVRLPFIFFSPLATARTIIPYLNILMKKHMGLNCLAIRISFKVDDLLNDLVEKHVLLVIVAIDGDLEHKRPIRDHALQAQRPLPSTIQLVTLQWRTQ
ncbi:hypothetical protein EVAR_77483_1 [Eumeta japonica]|uniref:Uncharacterized protein n=1 Tax=Eumeta variegata TaxID=151549 RepID=A0A4C1T905_EUMVA|nr:hypothetical protein EVAR_77483_1 [Eumeta japonica]